MSNNSTEDSTTSTIRSTGSSTAAIKYLSCPFHGKVPVGVPTKVERDVTTLLDGKPETTKEVLDGYFCSIEGCQISRAINELEV